VIVTELPIGPPVGDRFDMSGPEPTAKGIALLATPETVTTTFPVVAPAGTGAVIDVEAQQVPQIVANVPLNVRVLDPWLDPKFTPLIAMEVPIGPAAGFKAIIAGEDPTPKIIPLLVAPPTVTKTKPVVAPFGTVTVIADAPQLATLARTPLRVTVLDP
jgi:hypothetical protein